MSKTSAMPPRLKEPGKKPSRRRPKLPRISDEAERLSALLEAEVRGWPEVTMRPLFGLNGLYRGRDIFAVLPRTRSMGVIDSIAFRFPRRSDLVTERMRKDKRIVTPRLGAKWISFVIESEEAIHDALSWLELAYLEVARSEHQSVGTRN